MNFMVIGLGKTTIMLTMDAVQRIVNLMHDDVTDARAQADTTRHLATGTEDSPQSEDASCSSGNPFGLACLCVDKSISNRIKKKEGIHLHLVPTKLLVDLIVDFEACFLKQEGSGEPASNPLGMHFVLAHGDAEKGRYRDYRWTRRAIDEMSSETFEGEDENSRPRPKAGSSRYIVATTVESFHLENGVTSKFMRYREEFIPQPDREIKHKRRRNEQNELIEVASTFEPVADQRKVTWWSCLPICHIHRDEFDIHRLETSPAIKIFMGEGNVQYLRGFPYRWIFSGTPYDKGPIDLVFWFKVLENTKWKSDLKLMRCTESKIAKLAADWDAVVRKGDLSDKVFSPYVNAFAECLEAVAIKMTNKTRMIGTGDLISALPPLIELFVDCDHGEKWTKRLDQWYLEDSDRITKGNKARLEEWKHKGSKGLLPKPLIEHATAYRHRSLVCGGEPGLMNFVARYNLRLTEGQMIKQGWALKNTANCPFKKHIKDIVAASAHHKFIAHEVQRFRGLVDKEDNQVQMAIVSEYPVKVHCTFLHLTEVLGIHEDEICYVSPVFTKDKNNKALEVFLDRAWRLEGGKNGKKRTRPWILLAVRSTIGIGTNSLVGVVYMIIWEAWRSRGMERQVIGRIERPGNTHTTLYVTRLRASRNDTEETFISKQLNRLPMQYALARKAEIINLDDA